MRFVLHAFLVHFRVLLLCAEGRQEGGTGRERSEGGNSPQGSQMCYGPVRDQTRWQDRMCQKTARENLVGRGQWSKDGKEKRNPAGQEEEVRSSLLIFFSFFVTLCGCLNTMRMVFSAAGSQGICQLCHESYKMSKQKHGTELNLPECS